MATSSTQRGSLRVQSWIYEVLNPLLESLEIELVLLGRRDTTWRFYNRELEHLRPATRYLSLQGRHILRDYAMENPDLRGRLSSHDSLLRQLRDTASNAFDTLVASEEFREVVRDALGRYLGDTELDDIRTDPRYPGGAYPPERIPDLVAEHVVNSVDELPSQRTDKEFWEKHRDRFCDLATGAVFDELGQVVDSLITCDSELFDWIEQIRLELCRTYDVPAAPLSRAASE